MGDLGRRTMTIGSALDLLIVADASGTGAARSIGAQTAERLQEGLAWGSSDDPLYPPVVRHGPARDGDHLVTNLEAVGDHWADSGTLPEQLALTQARVIAGDAGTRSRLQALIQGVVTQRRKPSELRRAARAMSPSLTSPACEHIWDALRDGGTLLDQIHLLARYLILEHSHRTQDPIPVDLPNCFGTLEQAGVLSAAEAQTLLKAFRALQTVIAFGDLTFGLETHIVDASKAIGNRLARALGHESISDALAMIKRINVEACSIIQQRLGA